MAHEPTPATSSTANRGRMIALWVGGVLGVLGLVLIIGSIGRYTAPVPVAEQAPAAQVPVAQVAAPQPPAPQAGPAASNTGVGGLVPIVVGGVQPNQQTLGAAKAQGVTLQHGQASDPACFWADAKKTIWRCPNSWVKN